MTTVSQNHHACQNHRRMPVRQPVRLRPQPSHMPDPPPCGRPRSVRLPTPFLPNVRQAPDTQPVGCEARVVQLGLLAAQPPVGRLSGVLRVRGGDLEHRGSYNRTWLFLTDSGCRDRALLVPGPNTAKHATLVALLDLSTHFRPPLTHTSHHRRALVDLSRFRVSPILTHSIRFRCSSTCVPAVSGVSLVDISLLSADMAVTAVRPEVSQRVFIPRGRTRAHRKALVKAHTIVQ